MSADNNLLIIFMALAIVILLIGGIWLYRRLTRGLSAHSVTLDHSVCIRGDDGRLVFRASYVTEVTILGSVVVFVSTLLTASLVIFIIGLVVVGGLLLYLERWNLGPEYLSINPQTETISITSSPNSLRTVHYSELDYVEIYGNDGYWTMNLRSRYVKNPLVIKIWQKNKDTIELGTMTGPNVLKRGYQMETWLKETLEIPVRNISVN